MQEFLGYPHFFVWVILATIPSFHRRDENPAGRGIWEKNARELNCFERVKLSRIKAHMNSINFNRLCRAFVAAVLAVAAFEFLPAAQAFAIVDPILDFTNAAPKAIPRRASIIFIQVDGLGYGDLSCYGQTKFQTPNLDKLAAEGIRFTNYSDRRRKFAIAARRCWPGKIWAA